MTGTAFEKHYKPAELGKLWGFSRVTIQNWFRDEEGVLVQGERGLRRGKRECLTLRIPASVAERVYKQRTNRR